MFRCLGGTLQAKSQKRKAGNDVDHVGSLLLGLGNGAVFAALALALVLTYRSSGVINFATGAIAMFSAYTYASLRKGEMLLYLPGLPKSVDVGGKMAFF